MKRLILIFFFAFPAAFAGPSAFPGAEGFGGTATGGRGGRVLIVDSLTDNPRDPEPGTLRWACEKEEGPRIVVFRTGGVIELARVVEIHHPDLTIAAQTAPGQGICLKGSCLSIQANNVIVRGLRSRAGDGPVGPGGQNRRSFEIIGPVRDVMVDHCSFSWGVDDNVTVYANKEGQAPGNFTIQWCLLTEALYQSIHQQGPHSMAMTMGGGNIGPFSFHHNLLAHNNGRNPRVVWGAQGEFVNNVIYNWGLEATIIETVNPVKIRRDKRRPSEEEQRPALLNFIGNHWIAGQNTKPGKPEIRLKNITEGTGIYFKGNVGPNRPADTPAGVDEAKVMNRVKGVVTEEPAIALSGVTVHSSAAGKAAVLRSSGAILPSRDTVDQRVVADVAAGTGKIIDSPKEVGGYPDYSPETPLKDNDNDGMPDAWEIKHGLDEMQANANGRDLDAGYDNIEVYINGLFSSE